MAVLALGLTACATPAEQESPFYQAGFADGCATGSAETAPVRRNPQRDEALYATDSGYRAGWLSGRATCRMADGPPRL